MNRFNLIPILLIGLLLVSSCKKKDTPSTTTTSTTSSSTTGSSTTTSGNTTGTVQPADNSFTITSSSSYEAAGGSHFSYLLNLSKATTQYFYNATGGPNGNGEASLSLSQMNVASGKDTFDVSFTATLDPGSKVTTYSVNGASTGNFASMNLTISCHQGSANYSKLLGAFPSTGAYTYDAVNGLAQITVTNLQPVAGGNVSGTFTGTFEISSDKTTAITLTGGKFKAVVSM